MTLGPPRMDTPFGASSSSKTRPPVVPPQPVPCTVGMAVVTTSEDDWVMVSVDSPTGRFVFFLPADTAAAVAEGLAKSARHAATGLVVAQSPLA